MHSKYGWEKECLYNFWSSDSQNREAFLCTLSTSPFSLAKMSSLRSRTIGSIQLGSTLNWWIWTFYLFILVGLHRSSTRMTQGRLCAKEVARVDRESACVFLLLEIWCKEKESNPNCKSLAWFSSPFIWPTTNLESENIFTILPPIFWTIAIPTNKAAYLASLFVQEAQP